MKKIMFCGGGSAGHVIPNVAIIEDISHRYETVYLGTPSIEKSICRQFGIPFDEFEGVKLVRGKITCNLLIPFKLIKSYRACKEILKREKPDLLFCKGGYASLPPALAARSLKIPVLAHESDITAGLANKIISFTAERMLTSFPDTARKFKRGVFVGSPMRKCLFGQNKLEAKEKLNLDLRPAVLVFGGGSGSQIINQALRKSLVKLCSRYNIIHVCGKGNIVDTNIDGYTQMEFCNDMGLLYAAADYAVARCGSNSAHELIALKIPTLFIPLQNGSSRGDQVKNAEYFKDLGLCAVLSEKDLNAQTLCENVDALIKNEKIKTALSNYNMACGNRNIEIEIEGALNR